MKPHERNILATKFLLARKAKNLTQTFVANKIGIDQSQYQRIESGKLGIKSHKLILLCNILGIDLKELTDLSQENIDIVFSNSKFKEINDLKEIRRLAEAEIAKRDIVIHKLKRELKVLKQFY